MITIEEALASAKETKALEIGSGITGKIPEVFGRLFPGRRAVVVADGNTFAAAGREVCGVLAGAGIMQEEPFVFDAKGLYAEYGYVRRLAESLSAHTAVPVAVGSGTINDLAKLASHQTSREYMCVATAASMDGYTAFGASVTADGKKQTFNCPAPAGCIADIDIIRNAPEGMTAAGYADMFAKITAGADWILADALGEEPIDPTAWRIVQENLRGTLDAAGEMRNGNGESLARLINGLMLSGFAMQWHQTSRPASGAEHQFSHLWNMEHHTNGGCGVSHGFQVAIATLAVTALYEQALKTPFHLLDVERCVAVWPSERELTAKAAAMFRGTDFPDTGCEETAAKYIGAERLREQLTTLKNTWPELSARLAKQLYPFGEVKRRLAEAGAPTEPEQIGVSRRYLHDSFLRAQFIRRRYTVLDLAVRTGMFDVWLCGLFGGGGVWSLAKKVDAKGAPANH